MINSYFNDQIKKNLKSKLDFFLKQQCNGINEKYLFNKISIIVENVIINLEKWMTSNIPISCKEPIMSVIRQEKWNDLIDAFSQDLNFGTSGMRGKLTTSMNETDATNELLSLRDSRIHGKILRGTNTINEVTIAKFTNGLVEYMKKHKLSRLVIGYDSRTNSKVFSHLISKILLENGFTIFIFSNVTPLPELAFAVKQLKADMGIEITASHNDKRYNGLKLITSDGGPLNDNIRDEIAKEIFVNHKIQSTSINEVMQFNNYEIRDDKLICLDENRNSNTKNIQTFDIDSQYIDNIKNFIFQNDVVAKYSSELKIGYSAIHGTGYNIVSQLFKKLHFNNIKYISSMNTPNPIFPSFKINQILDPGDPMVANAVVDEFIKQYGLDVLESLDVLMYNDPDADRLGVITVSKLKEHCNDNKWKLHKADAIWTLLLWYILENLSKLNYFDRKNTFIVKNYLTSDALAAVSKKYGIECENGKVGFSDLSEIVRKKWKDNKINVGMFEESNGFSFAGNPLNHNIKSHILEKDGVLALMLIIEIAAYAKAQKTTISELLDNLYLDPDIGYYATFKTQIPDSGIFEGIKGELYKQQILQFVETLAEEAKNNAGTNHPLIICGIPVSKVEKYSTGKYDKIYWNNFPDEGIRFFLDSDTNHTTIRSSGTESKIRIFSQYKIDNINKNNLLEKKLFADKIAANIANEIKYKINSK